MVITRYSLILPILKLILLIRGLFGILKAHEGPLGTPNENVSVCICGLILLDFSGCTKIYPAVAHLEAQYANPLFYGDYDPKFVNRHQWTSRSQNMNDFWPKQNWTVQIDFSSFFQNLFYRNLSLDLLFDIKCPKVIHLKLSIGSPTPI